MDGSSSRDDDEAPALRDESPDLALATALTTLSDSCAPQRCIGARGCKCCGRRLNHFVTNPDRQTAETSSTPRRPTPSATARHPARATGGRPPGRPPSPPRARQQETG